MLNNLGLGIILTAKDEATAVLNRGAGAYNRLAGASEEAASRMQKSAHLVKAGFGIMGLGAVGIGTAFTAALQGGKFEEGLSNLRVVAGATAEEMAKFRQEILTSDKSLYNPRETADAMRELAAQGLTAGEVLKTINPVLDYATASLGELGVAEAAGIAGQAMKAFGRSADDAGIMVDRMVKTANLFAVAHKDMPMALSNSSRGAQLLGQSFEETLVTFGLVKNVISRVESAATATSVGMERLANPKFAQHLKGLATVWDQHGKARPFLDILNEMTVSMQGMTDKAKTERLIKVFGTEGLSGVSAIMKQLATGVTKTNGEIVKGSKAIEYLRSQIDGAKGTAKDGVNAKLQTLPGQMELLKASMGRLMVVIGEPFARVFEPIVRGIVGGITSIKNVILGLPAGVKQGFAKVFVAISGLAVAFGAFVAAKGAIVALAFGMKLLGITIAGLLVTLLPIAGVFAGIILMVKAFKAHSEQTGGGVIGVFSSMWEKIKLFGQGIMQLFQEGGFSGAVMDELNKAENSGVKAFAIKVFMWIERIRNFFTGLSDGFGAAITRLRPWFDLFVDSIKSIGAAFGMSVGPADQNKAAWDSAGNAGRSLGEILASVAAIISGVLGTALYIGAGVVGFFTDAFRAVWPVVVSVGQVIGNVIGFVTNLLTGQWGKAWEAAVGVVIGAVKTIVNAFGGVLQFVGSVVDRIGKIAGKDLGIGASIGDMMKSNRSSLDDFQKSMASGAMFDGTVQTFKAVPAGMSDMFAGTADLFASQGAGLAGMFGMQPSPKALPVTMPRAEALADAPGVQATQVIAAAAQRAPVLAQASSAAPQTINMPVSLILDGEKVAERMISKQIDWRKRSGSPVVEED